MDPITLALGIFGTLASGLITYAIHRHDSDETTPGTSAYYNKQALDMTQSNLALNEKTAQQNYDLSKEQFEYQKQLNELTMQREDTSYQRQIKDLQSAGLSPLMIGNGANASPLTSASAPQFDISGINTAVGNAIGAYNDIYNRKMNNKQFRVQSALSLSNMYTQLAESKLNRDYIKLQTNYLDEKMKWEKSHGFRDLSLGSELINLAESILSKYGKNSVNPNLSDNLFPGVNLSLPDVKDKLDNLLFDKVDNNHFISLGNNNVTKKDIEKDIKTINDSTQKRIDKWIMELPSKKSLNTDKGRHALRNLWEFSNVDEYFKDYDTFVSTLASQNIPANYLNKLKISVRKRELKLGI